MASYFDEHNCEELREGQTPDHFLQFSRFLLHGGYWEVIEEEFAQLFNHGDKPPPPASKKVVEELDKFSVKEKDGQCYICLKEWKLSIGEEGVSLPCSHNFHRSCILPWLNRKRKKEREEDLENLHNSMFS
ncbi:E3 ubiquitin-protein ligase [Armadillidium nasatum]|uniref:E3 ubiquitin-protein ligase n=1 Tax=Armadillidium nasatum TaxID=96803 RepID=A0A5N5SSC0_9CRUS|nr:E3 ubiquitin-protein ligase [Armadillidium nasatum]